MAHNIAWGKGTKRNKSLGEYGLKRSGGAGKGPILPSSFGDGWLKETEGRINKRQFACSACGFDKPSGKCPRPECGHQPEGNRGW